MFSPVLTSYSVCKGVLSFVVVVVVDVDVFNVVVAASDDVVFDVVVVFV